MSAQNAVLEKWERRADAVQSIVCVGLDPELERLPARFRSAAAPLFEFNRWIIEQTHPYAAAYKPNMAFYEAHGSRGVRELELTIEYLRAEHPHVVTICDAKRADIGNTNRGYVRSIFDELGFDAVTLHPYLGREALAPFLEREDKACIVLCRTSNPGAGEFQDLLCAGQPLWQTVAVQVSTQWNTRGNCMLVVGATYPDEMRQIRAVAPELTFLVPGLGAQGGDVSAVVAAGLNAHGNSLNAHGNSLNAHGNSLNAHGSGLMLASGRAILFSEDPATAAREFRNEIASAVASTLKARGGL